MKTAARLLRCFVQLAVPAAVLSGCANLAPDYRQPAAPVPQSWPSGAAPAPVSASADLLAMGWQEFFIDERLRRVVALAVDNNRDLRVAALNIERVRALYGVKQAAIFPGLQAGASGSRGRTLGGQSEGGSSRVSSQYSVNLGLVRYELDLFGRVHNLNEAALQTYFRAAETRRSAQISLVAEVATAWLTLAADGQRLQLARNTLASQRKSFELVERSHALGAQSGLSLAQAQSTVDAARVEVAAFDAQVERDGNALALLVGTGVPAELLPPQGDKERAVQLAPAARLLVPPAGLPSSVLQQRPDVLAAEHALQAGNADIGAARAAFYPSISLTGAVGTASRTLSSLFGNGSRTWGFSPQITLPIFDGGANRANLRVAEAQQQILLADYEKTLQIAFREVADALASRRTLAERLDAQQSLVASTSRSFELSQALFRSGSGGFLEVLVAQRSLYAVQQSLIDLQAVEQVNRLTLYKVLGGGWSEAGPVSRGPVF